MIFLSFDLRLKELRNERGLSQKALADLVFVSQQTVAKWETAKSTPNPEMLIKLSEILGVPAGYLIGADEVGGKLPPSEMMDKLIKMCATLSKEELHEVLNYVGYIKSKKHLQD